MKSMPPSPQEMMVVAAAREVQDKELVFVGMRLPLLSFLLAQATHAPGAIGLYENGVIRTKGAKEMLYTMSDPPNVTGATQATEMIEIMGLLQSGRVGLGFVGAAQADRFGNLNSTEVLTKKGKTRLPGSGGAADIASLACRLVTLLPHRQHRLPKRVDYLTSPGYGTGKEWRQRVGLPRGGPVAVITDLAVLRFNQESREAEVASIHPGVSREQVSTNTGWAIPFASQLQETPQPTAEEISILRGLDPQGFWLADRP